VRSVARTVFLVTRICEGVVALAINQLSRAYRCPEEKPNVG
jgi:hypothetical protein